MTKKITFGSLLLFFLLFSLPVFAADGTLSVTLTPPLYQLTIGPGENWTSSLKIVNNNSYPVTYYAQVVDMEARGESGESKLTPLIGPQDPDLESTQLARWVKLGSNTITVKPGTSGTLNFTVNVPRNAEPGGHYAAILVGTQPLAATSSGSYMNISSFVSSLLFVRIKGDVVESGRIREFSSNKDLYQEPNAEFVIRFENTGNTHVKPEGDVTIYNMWGKERGKVVINQDANFGSVLPKTIRRFEFSWEGEQNVFDIGRYSAVITLAYGQDEKKNISAVTYFWVVPIVPVSIALGTIITFFMLLAWFIRRYIRRALELERQRFGEFSTAPSAAPIFETFVEPLKEGVVDLRAATMARKGKSESHSAEMVSNGYSLSKREFIRKYRLFFAFIAVLAICAVAGWVYFAKVLVSNRDYNIKEVSSQSEELRP
jgi:hypothetical protein